MRLCTLKACQASLWLLTEEALPKITDLYKYLYKANYVKLFADQRIGKSDDHFRGIMLTDKVINTILVSFSFGFIEQQVTQ